MSKISEEKVERSISRCEGKVKEKVNEARTFVTQNKTSGLTTGTLKWKANYLIENLEFQFKLMKDRWDAWSVCLETEAFRRKRALALVTGGKINSFLNHVIFWFILDPQYFICFTNIKFILEHLSMKLSVLEIYYFCQILKKSKVIMCKVYQSKMASICN